MNQQRSATRITIIVTEYLKQIAKYAKKYRGYPEFPFLSDEEFELSFQKKKIEIRSHFRMLALAVLAEYISVQLNTELSERINSIIYSNTDEDGQLEKEDPLIFLLTRLHVNKEEIESEIDNSIHFETFMILEREYRQENKFSELLYRIDATEPEYLVKFKINAAADSRNDVGFWNSRYDWGQHLGEQLVSNKDVLLKTVDLLNFLNELANFLQSVKSDFLASCFWFYYSHFFKAVRLIRPYLETFFVSSDNSMQISWIARSAELTEEEVSQLFQNINKAARDINWLLDTRQHSALTNFIRLYANPQEIFVTVGGMVDDSGTIDLNALRKSIRN